MFWNRTDVWNLSVSLDLYFQIIGSSAKITTQYNHLTITNADQYFPLVLPFILIFMSYIYIYSVTLSIF